MTEKGKITHFYVIARCPHCEEGTEVYEDEYESGFVDCQHCNEEFEL